MKEEKTTIYTNEEFSVKEIEAKLQDQPNNNELKKELAYTLLDRHLFGAETPSADDDSDLMSIRELIRALPEDMALLPRAYIAHIDENPAEAAKWFARHAAFLVEGEPLSCDELYNDLIMPFEDAPP